MKISYEPRINVLHIENDADVHEEFHQLLTERNVYVHVVDNLADAKRVLKRAKVDVLISDGMFPKKKGAAESKNFIPLMDFIRANGINTTVIPWSNSTHVHEYCKKKKIPSYSKILLTRERFKEKGRAYIDVAVKTPTEMTEIIEEKLRERFGFSALVQKHRFVETYSEPATVLVFFLAGDMRTKFLKETAGLNYGPILGEIKDGLFTLYLDSASEKKISESIYKKILRPGFYENVFRQVNARGKHLLSFARSLKSLPYGTYSNSKLEKLYLEFARRLMAMRMYSSLPMALEHQRSPWTILLLSLLSERIPEPAERNRLVSILTSPELSSYVNEYQRVVAEFGVQREGGNNSDDVLQNILKKYAWVLYTAEGTPIVEQDVLRTIDEIRGTHGSLQDFLTEQEERIPSLQKEKADIVAEYQLTKKEKRYFDIGAGLVYLKFFRKGIFAESYYSVEFLLAEIGRRIGCSTHEVANMFPNEVLAVLRVGSFPCELIVGRMKHSVIWAHSGQSYPLSASAQRVYEAFIEKEESVSEIKGQIAYAGIASGAVRIVNVPGDMAGFQEGDVLVSRSTNPSLISAMHRASAFVTDTGGLTCHAAIVAREMHKPCIVGTKVATKMLKDGDMVEVDAKRGIVTILARSPEVS